MRKHHHRSRHPHRRPRQDRLSSWTTHGHVDRHALSRHAGARLREVHRRPALLRDAVHHRAHLRHLSRSATCWRRAKACDAIMAVRAPARRRQAARTDPLRAVRAVARPQLLPPLGARPAAGHRFRPGAAQHLRPDRRSTRRWRATASALRKFGQEIIEGLAEERVHPSWIVPGGVNAPLVQRGPRPHSGRACRKRAPSPAARWTSSRACSTRFRGEIDNFGTDAHHVRRPGGSLAAACNVRRPACASAMPPGATVAADIRARDYARVHRRSRPARFLPEGALLQARRLSRRAVYRVGPLARLNVADECGTPEADRELAEFRQRFGAMVHSSFHFHYARLIELLHALEKIEVLLDRSRASWTRTCAPAPA